MNTSSFAPHIILADADYLDSVAFDLTVNFERMLGRRIPPADLCHWADCVALDGGLRPGDNHVQLHLLHSGEKETMRCFAPSTFREVIEKISFDDNIGHFELFAFPVEKVVTMKEFFLQSLAMLLSASEVKSLMVVGDMNVYGAEMKDLVRQAEGKDITLFTMKPTTGRGFSQEILGYSLLSALGIRGDELKE